MKASSKGGLSQAECKPQAAKGAGKVASGARVVNMFTSSVMPAVYQVSARAPQCLCGSLHVKPLNKEFDSSSAAMECI